MLSVRVRTVNAAKKLQDSSPANSHFLCVPQSGRAILNCEGKNILLTEGTVILLPSGQSFTVESYSPVSCFACIYADKAQLMQNGIKKDSSACYLQKDDHIRIHEVIEKMLQEQTSRKIGYEAAMQELFSSLLCLILRRGKKITGLQQKLTGVLQFIQENYSRDITLHDLAELAGVSVSHFRRVFQKEYSISPIDYLLDLRLQKAQGLLEDPGVPVARIAVMTGFNDANYFSRLFSDRLGKSPRCWRQSFLKK